MFKTNEDIIRAAAYNLEVEDLHVTVEETKKVRDMLEGKRTCASVVAEYIERGKALGRKYANV